MYTMLIQEHDVEPSTNIDNNLSLRFAKALYLLKVCALMVVSSTLLFFSYLLRRYMWFRNHYVIPWWLGCHVLLRVRKREVLSCSKSCNLFILSCSITSALLVNLGSSVTIRVAALHNFSNSSFCVLAGSLLVLVSRNWLYPCITLNVKNARTRVFSVNSPPPSPLPPVFGCYTAG